MSARTALNRRVRPFVTAILAGLLGFAAARISESPFAAKSAARTGAAAPSPQRETQTTASASPAPVAPSPDPVKPLAERFKAALGSAAQVLAVIDAMTAANFQHLADDPRSVSLPYLGSPDAEVRDGFMDVLIERWFAVDAAGAVAGILAAEKKLIIGPGQVWVGSGEFSAALARVRPDLMIEVALEKGSWDRYNHDIPTAFTVLGERDPAAARRFLERIADPDLRRSAEGNIACGVAAHDPLAGMVLALSLRDPGVFKTAIFAADRLGSGALEQVLSACERKFPKGLDLSELILRHPDVEWGTITRDGPGGIYGGAGGELREAARIAPEKRLHILDRLPEFPPDAGEKIATALVAAWSREEPQQATEWALAHADTMDAKAAASRRVAAAFSQWSIADRETATSWWMRQKDSALRTELGNKLAVTLARAGDIAYALALFHPPTGGEVKETAPISEEARMEAAIAAATAHAQARADPLFAARASDEAEDATTSLALAQAKTDPQAAAAWLDSLPAEIDTGKAVAPFLQKWIESDAVNAARWVESQPAGARRDAALKAYAVAATELDPAAAGEWAKGIGDPKVREQTAESVFLEMDRRDPAAARAWLRALPGADAAWSERVIRLSR